MANQVDNPTDPLFRAAQDDLPVTEHPFAALAANHGVGEDALLEALRAWARSGVVRRYGALVSHRKLGYECNAMVVWQVPPEQVDLVGQLFARDPDVTHCYARLPAPGFPYNLYTMIHSHSEDECRRKAENLARAADVPAYEMLVSTREFKKESPRYAALRSAETAERS
jgi:DNA-binding Lrp family transcriptional regulator